MHAAFYPNRNEEVMLHTVLNLTTVHLDGCLGKNASIGSSKFMRQTANCFPNLSK